MSEQKNTHKTMHVSELTEEDLAALAKSKVDSKYDYLNKELESAPIEQIARDASFLPCPFCGGENLEVFESDAGYQMICVFHPLEPSCGCASGYQNTKELAIMAWNTRQACGQQPAVPSLSDEAWKFLQDHDADNAQRESITVVFEGDFGNWNWLLQEIYKRCSAALAVPEGYKLVPIEPTGEMREACRLSIADSLGTGDETLIWWRAFLAAAPSLPMRQPLTDKDASELCTHLATTDAAIDHVHANSIMKMAQGVIETLMAQQPAPTGWRDISEAAEDEKLEILGCNQKTGHMWIGHMFKFPNPEVGWKFTANAVIRPATHWRIVTPPHPVRGGEQ